MVDQYGDAHLRLVDVSQRMFECACRAALMQGMSRTSRRDGARREVGRTGGDCAFRGLARTACVRAITDAQATADAGAEKTPPRARRGAQGEGGQGFRLLSVEPEAQAQHAHPAGHASRIEEELAACGTGLAGGTV